MKKGNSRNSWNLNTWTVEVLDILKGVYWLDTHSVASSVPRLSEAAGRWTCVSFYEKNLILWKVSSAPCKFNGKYCFYPFFCFACGAKGNGKQLCKW